MRVATFATTDRMLAASLKTQARMADVQLQQASGSKSTTYGGLGLSARALLQLETNLSASQAYENAAAEAARRTEVMSSTLSTISDLLTAFRSELTAAMGNSRSESTDTALIASAEVYLDELASLLNTKYEGRYLFAGDATTTAPVDLTDWTADVSTADASYYQGDETIVAVRVAADQSISYGVKANDPAFEGSLRAIALVAQAGSLDDQTLAQSYEMLLAALDDTVVVQSTVGAHVAALERSQERHESYQLLLENAISHLRDTDVAAVAVTLASYETQLQASYSALAKVQSLSLLDYLR